MNKFLILLAIIGWACLIAGFYGILNDRLMYAIAPEHYEFYHNRDRSILITLPINALSPKYYEKIKEYQFGLITVMDNTNSRLGVSATGFLSAWWMGLPIGIILGFIGLMHKNTKQMLYTGLKAIAVTFIVTLATGLIGLVYGKFYLANTGIDWWEFSRGLVSVIMEEKKGLILHSWWVSESLTGTKNFITAGSMHNFSYFGGLIGLIAGIVYSVKQKYTTADTNKEHIKPQNILSNKIQINEYK
jgi:hypothetical protein